MSLNDVPRDSTDFSSGFNISKGRRGWNVILSSLNGRAIVITPNCFFTLFLLGWNALVLSLVGRPMVTSPNDF